MFYFSYLYLALPQNQYLTMVDFGSKVSIRASKSSKGDFNSRKCQLEVRKELFP